MRVGKLMRVGNSVSVVLARSSLRRLGWVKGDVVAQEIKGKEIVLRNVTPRSVRFIHDRADYGDKLTR